MPGWFPGILMQASCTFFSFLCFCVLEQEGQSQQRQGVWKGLLYSCSQLHRLSPRLTLSQQDNPTRFPQPSYSLDWWLVVVKTGPSCLVSLCFYSIAVNGKTDGSLKLNKACLLSNKSALLQQQFFFQECYRIKCVVTSTETSIKLVICL